MRSPVNSVAIWLLARVAVFFVHVETLGQVGAQRCAQLIGKLSGGRS